MADLPLLVGDSAMRKIVDIPWPNPAHFHTWEQKSQVRGLAVS
jgi:hypothetical protein